MAKIMSPRIEKITQYARNGHIVERRELIVDIPDRSGSYETLYGRIWVVAHNIHPSNTSQEIIFSGEIFRGKDGRTTHAGERRVQLSKDGFGSQTLSPTEKIEVTLHQAIQVTDAKHGLVAEHYPDYPEFDWTNFRHISKKHRHDQAREIRMQSRRTVARHV